MTRHVLDKQNPSEGLEREVAEFARVEREQGEAGLDPRVQAMNKAKAEPPGDDPRRIGEFLKQDRAAG